MKGGSLSTLKCMKTGVITITHMGGQRAGPCEWPSGQDDGEGQRPARTTGERAVTEGPRSPRQHQFRQPRGPVLLEEVPEVGAGVRHLLGLPGRTLHAFPVGCATDWNEPVREGEPSRGTKGLGHHGDSWGLKLDTIHPCVPHCHLKPPKVRQTSVCIFITKVREGATSVPVSWGRTLLG